MQPWRGHGPHCLVQIGSYTLAASPARDEGCEGSPVVISKHPAESIPSAFLILGAARISVLCMNLIATSHAAKALGAPSFGLNSFAISYVAYFMIVTSLGYDTFVAREIACDRSCMKPLVNTMLSVRLILSCVMFLLLIASLSFMRFSTLGCIVLLIQAVNIPGSAFGLTPVYQGLRQMRIVAQREFLSAIVNMVGLLWLVHAPEDVVIAATVSVFTTLLANLTILLRYVNDYGRPRLHWPKAFDRERTRHSMTYFWAVLAITITYNAHIVLLGMMRSEVEVGLFAAGWKLFNFAIVIPNLVSTLFLPHIAAMTSKPIARARSAELQMQTCVICGVPIALIGETLVPHIIRGLFGAAYLPVSGAVHLLLLNALVVTLNIGFGTPLTAVGRQTVLFRIAVAGAVADVILCSILIPYFGIEGAAFATLIDEIMILGLFVATRPEVSVSMTLELGLRCLLAVIPAAGVAHVLAHSVATSTSDLLAVIVGGSAGIIIYGLMLPLLRIHVWQFVTELRQV